MYDQLILVDESDQEIGVADKVTAHVDGLLHRAFSVFLFNSKGEMLLQRRASGKYHSAGLWSNTVCSHPRPGETTRDACARRLVEEMGMAADVEFAFSFLYKTKFENGLTEHEFDHVFIGRTDEEPRPEAAEVADYKYVSLEQLRRYMAEQPDEFTVWFRICLPRVESYLDAHPEFLRGKAEH